MIYYNIYFLEIEMKIYIILQEGSWEDSVDMIYFNELDAQKYYDSLPKTFRDFLIIEKEVY